MTDEPKSREEQQRQRNAGGWNYRVMRRTYPEHGEVLVAVYEVYYDDDGEPNGWTAHPSYPTGDDVETLKEDLQRYLRAFDEPVLEWVWHGD